MLIHPDWDWAILAATPYSNQSFVLTAASAENNTRSTKLYYIVTLSELLCTLMNAIGSYYVLLNHSVPARPVSLLAVLCHMIAHVIHLNQANVF